jgi:hypothetical protein
MAVKVKLPSFSLQLYTAHSDDVAKSTAASSILPHVAEIMCIGIYDIEILHKSACGI